MIGAIGSTPIYGGNVAAPSPAGLEVLLDKYKAQLADWESCPACNTAQGKAKIAEISSKIADLKARLAAADAAQPSPSTVAPDSKLPAAANDAAGAALPGAPDATSPGARPALTVIGTRLDVFA